MMRSFLTTNSIKYLRSLVKNFPEKIYSIEIKFKTETKPSPIKQINSTTTSGLLDSNKTSTTTTTTSNSDNSSISSQNQRIGATLIDESTTVPSAIYSTIPDIFINQIDDVPDVPSHAQLIARTRQLVNSLNIKYDITSKPSSLLKLNVVLKELSKHFEKNPVTSTVAIDQNVILKLLNIREFSQVKLDQNGKPGSVIVDKDFPLDANNANIFNSLNANSRQVLSQLGYADPPKGRGIRILSIDGGGTRGILVIEMLRQIENLYGKPIHKIFDLICGVSTGSILATLLGALRIPLDECIVHYRQASNVFKNDILSGTGRLLWSHAYYDTAVWEKILKEIYGDTVLLHTRRNKECPHIVAISAIVNLPTLQPYLFRNYELHPSSKPLSNFEGGSSHKLWEAVRASAAAPGYFEEFPIGKHVHQDGGILINNPTAIAVHEAKLLWPNEEIQCVVSLGSGRYQPTALFETEKTTTTPSSLKHKILRLIDSATDTEMVHRLMQDLLPHNTYFRFNPVLRDCAMIDETRPEILERMKTDAKMYMRRNDHKVNQSMKKLKLERTYTQSLLDLIKLKTKFYF